MEVNPKYLNGASCGKSITARGVVGVLVTLSHANGSTNVVIARDDNGKHVGVMCFWDKLVDIRATNILEAK